MRRYLVFVVLSVMIGACDSSDSPTITDGYSYWLPAGVQQSEDAGLVAVGSDLIENLPDLSGNWAQAWRPRWNWFHTGPGEFDFSLFDEKLEQASQTGSTIQVNLFSSESSYVPSWILQEYSERVRIGDRVYAPAWRAEIREQFAAFVGALGKRYAGNPLVSTWYIHGISASQGEELWLGTQDSANDLYWAGCPPETLVVWLSHRLDAFADAFVGHTERLLWVGGIESNRYFQLPAGEGGLSWRDASSILAHHAWSHGMGHRGGNIERVWNKAGWRDRVDTTWSQQTIVGTHSLWDHRHGYLEINESLWQDRITGEENEEYGPLPHWVDRFGPVEHHPIRYELSMLRALQMRVSWLWVHADGMSMNEPLTHYVRLSLGKLWDDSPDAFCRLCSSPSSDYYVGGRDVRGIDGHEGLHYMRNIERFLYQRDVPASDGVLGGITVPTDKVYRTYDALNLSSRFRGAYRYDNLAVRTDLDTGNPCIYFLVDDQWSPSVVTKLLVTYRGTGKWRVEYKSAGGLTSTPFVVGSGDIQTAWFDLVDPIFDGSISGMDFRIVSENVDVEVRLVRLIRQ